MKKLFLIFILISHFVSAQTKGGKSSSIDQVFNWGPGTIEDNMRRDKLVNDLVYIYSLYNKECWKDSTAEKYMHSICSFGVNCVYAHIHNPVYKTRITHRQPSISGFIEFLKNKKL